MLKSGGGFTSIWRRGILTTANLPEPPASRPEPAKREEHIMDLSTTYLGLKLRTPFVPSASPLSEDLDNIKAMEDAGAAAVVFHSLFEEQIRLERNELIHHLTFG